MTSLTSILVSYIVFNQLVVNVFSMNASPFNFNWTQPNNEIVSCLYLYGSPHYHYMKTCDNYTVIEEMIDGEEWLMYAVPDDNLSTVGRIDESPIEKTMGNHIGLKSSGIKVKDNDEEVIANLHSNVRPRPSSNIDIFHGEEESNYHQNLRNLASSSSTILNSGVMKNLVVLMRFQDDLLKPVPSRDDIDVLFNHRGKPYHNLAPTGSIYDYFYDVSFGKFSVESTVVNWIDMPRTAAYYANGYCGIGKRNRVHEMWHFALDQLENDPHFSFKDFDINDDGIMDGITLIHSGYGAEFGGIDYKDRIWSHKWTAPRRLRWKSSEGVTVNKYHISPGIWGSSGSGIGRIGVICHELGHFLGLLDLYDIDESDGNGIGSFGLMANSWGFDGSQHYPPTLSAWSKIQLGWLEPTVISETGMYEIEAATSAPVAYRVDENFPEGEYLLIENRQKKDYDSEMGHGGLLIYHIDDNAAYSIEGYPGQVNWPTNGNHYRVAVLQADGSYDLERGANRGDVSDLFHGQGVNQLSSTSIERTKDNYPNTDPYRVDMYGHSNMFISQISDSQQKMSFQLFKLVPALLIDGAGFCKSYRGINPLLPEYPLRKTGGKRRCSAYDTADQKWEKCLALCYPKCPRGYRRFGCNMCRKGWFKWKGRGWGRIHRCHYGEFIYNGECHAECGVGYERHGGRCKSRQVYPKCEEAAYPNRCNEHLTVCSDDCSKIKDQQGTKIENKLQNAPLCNDISFLPAGH